MTQYAVIYEKGEHNCGAIVPDLPGCVSIGDTLEEVQVNVKEAISPPPSKVEVVFTRCW